MVNYIKSELIKQKSTFNNKIIFGVIFVCCFIDFLLMGPGYLQASSYNGWYVLYLPFVFTFISAEIIKNDKKHNFHGLFSIVEDKKNIWYAKICVGLLYLAAACLIFAVTNIIFGITMYKYIPVKNSIMASAVLFITFAWQIPFFMFITLKTNIFISVIASVVGNLAIACTLAPKAIWRIPFAIPARLMCPLIKVHPNGTLLEAGDPLLNGGSIIVQGVLISAALFIIVSIITGILFKKEEV